MNSIEITISSRVAILKAKQDNVRYVELNPGVVYVNNVNTTKDIIIDLLRDKQVSKISFYNGLGDPITLRVRYENI